MKVRKNRVTFEITGITDAAEAARFLRQNGFEIVSELPDRAAELLRAAVAPKQTCPSCSGAGYWIDTTNLHVECRQCNGTGQV